MWCCGLRCPCQSGAVWWDQDGFDSLEQFGVDVLDICGGQSAVGFNSAAAPADDGPSHTVCVVEHCGALKLVGANICEVANAVDGGDAIGPMDTFVVGHEGHEELVVLWVR